MDSFTVVMTFESTTLTLRRFSAIQQSRAESFHGTSHKVFKKGEGFVNLQEGNAGKAKPYQVRQARETLKKLNLHP
jgi:hypothetical protein